MAPLDPAAVTMLLQRWTQGEPKAIEQVLPLVYDELRSIARSYMSRERVGHTLGATALVHETFLRLAEQTPDSWRDLLIKMESLVPLFRDEAHVLKANRQAIETCRFD